MTRPRPEPPVAFPAGGQRDGPRRHREGTVHALHAACSDAFSLRSVAFTVYRRGIRSLQAVKALAVVPAAEAAAYQSLDRPLVAGLSGPCRSPRAGASSGGVRPVDRPRLGGRDSASSDEQALGLAPTHAEQPTPNLFGNAGMQAAGRGGPLPAQCAAACGRRIHFREEADCVSMCWIALQTSSSVWMRLTPPPATVSCTVLRRTVASALTIPAQTLFWPRPGQRWWWWRASRREFRPDRRLQCRPSMPTHTSTRRPRARCEAPAGSTPAARPAPAPEPPAGAATDRSKPSADPRRPGRIR